MDVDSIRNRAQGVTSGRVTAAEVEFARDILRTRQGDVAAAIIIVGWCGSAEDAPLIESYLDGAEREVVGELALKALCRYLNLIARYRPLVRRLIVQPERGDWAQSRMAAIHLCDKYFDGFNDNELACNLVSIFSDPADKDRLSARLALIKILDLKDELTMPVILDYDDIDRDEAFIVGVARQRFGCKSAVN